MKRYHIYHTCLSNNWVIVFTSLWLHRSLRMTTTVTGRCWGRLRFCVSEGMFLTWYTISMWCCALWTRHIHTIHFYFHRAEWNVCNMCWMESTVCVCAYIYVCVCVYFLIPIICFQITITSRLICWLSGHSSLVFFCRKNTRLLCFHLQAREDHLDKEE